MENDDNGVDVNGAEQAAHQDRNARRVKERKKMTWKGMKRRQEKKKRFLIRFYLIRIRDGGPVNECLVAHGTLTMAIGCERI